MAEAAEIVRQKIRLGEETYDLEAKSDSHKLADDA